MKKNFELYRVTIKDQDFHKDIEVLKEQLDHYNPKNEQNFTDLVIYNFNSEYQQKIGLPFIIRIRRSYPLSAVREAIENCLTHLGNCHIKLVSRGNLNICQLCRTADCNGSIFLLIQDAFMIMKDVTQFNGLRILGGM